MTKLYSIFLKSNEEKIKMFCEVNIYDPKWEFSQLGP
mgnify:CR=1 FL=1